MLFDLLKILRQASLTYQTPAYRVLWASDRNCERHKLSFQWWPRAKMRHGHGLIDQMKNLILSYKDGSVIELGENWVASLILEPVKSHSPSKSGLHHDSAWHPRIGNIVWQLLVKGL